MNLVSTGTPRRPTRVLHVVGSMNRGGVETWLMNVLRNISRDELVFDFMVHKPDAAAYDEELLALGANRYVCQWPSNPLIYARNFLKILRENGPYDVVHSHVHHFSGFVLLLAKLAGVPIRVAHSHSDTTMSQNRASTIRRLYFNITASLIKFTSTTGISASEKAAIALFGNQWRSDKRWKVIYCGIDLKAFASPVSALEVRRELGIPEHAFIVGHVGRFDEPKNHSLLVDIFEHLKKTRPEAVLLLTGDGNLRSKIEEKVNSIGLQNDVIFTGLRSDVPRIMMGAMDVFLFPSKYEGLPLSLIEAQIAGLHCVASDSITPEANISDNCIFVPLASNLETWVNAICLQVRQNTTKNIQEDLFDIKLTNKKLFDVYKFSHSDEA